MFLKLITLFLSLSANNVGSDSTITEAQMIGKWHINYCYDDKTLHSCKNCQKETADLIYVFKKKVFSEVMEDPNTLVPDRRYGSWSLVNNLLTENTSQNLNGKIINYVHEYKLIKLSDDKYYAVTTEGGAPLYIYYCRVK